MHNTIEILRASLDEDQLNTHLHTQGSMFRKLPGELHQHPRAVQRRRAPLLPLTLLKLRGERGVQSCPVSAGMKAAVMKALRGPHP